LPANSDHGVPFASFSNGLIPASLIDFTLGEILVTPRNSRKAWV
jgi:hypothetical protein